MHAYKPKDFWEESHSAIPENDVKLGFGIHHVGGGQSDSEAAALYQLRQLNAHRVLKKCALPPNPKIFELGSGGGFWVEFFRHLAPKNFVGSDLSATAVKRLSSNYPDYDFVLMQSEQEAWTRIQDLAPYDLSLAIDVLYHITDDGTWTDVITRLCQNTAPSGLLLIADYFHEKPVDQPSKIHVKFRKMQNYLTVLDQQGFRVEEVQPIFYFLNRTVSGPWRDHNRLLSPALRFAMSNIIGLKLATFTDAILTKFVRPMNPACTTRFLLARKLE